MALIQFQCPTCGGPLEDPGEGTTMHCPYCAAVFMVPQELLAARSSRTTMAAAGAPATAAYGNTAPASAVPVAKYFKEDFSKPANNWDVGQRSDGVTLAYDNGAYRIYLPEDDSGWEAFSGGDYTDFSVEVELARIKGPKDGEYGLTCRVGEDGGYSFWLTGEGYYGIGKFYYGETDDDEEEYVEMAEAKAGFMQLSSSFNRLRADCVGHKFTMYLNGKKVLEAADNEFGHGDISLMAQTGESGKGGLDVRFKNLMVSGV
jgi:hypothetical protein